MYRIAEKFVKRIRNKIALKIEEAVDKKMDYRVDNKKVLLNDCQKIGNYIFKTPLIRGLSLAGYEVYILGSKLTKELGDSNPHVKEVIVDGAYKKKAINIFRNMYTGLKYRGKFHMFIDNTGLPQLREIVVPKLMRVEKVVGVQNKKGRMYKIMDIQIPIQKHASMTSVVILEHLGIKDKPTYDLPLTTDKYSNIELEKPLVLFNSKGSKPSTTLKEDERLAIIEEMSKMENIDFREIERQDTIEDLCSLIKRASIVVTVDTGVVHIASAYNIPTIVHTNTNGYVLPTVKKNWVLDIRSKDLKNFFYRKNLKTLELA